MKSGAVTEREMALTEAFLCEVALECLWEEWAVLLLQPIQRPKALGAAGRPDASP